MNDVERVLRVSALGLMSLRGILRLTNLSADKALAQVDTTPAVYLHKGYYRDRTDIRCAASRREIARRGLD